MAETPTTTQRGGAPLRPARGALLRARRLRRRERSGPHLRQPRPARPRADADAAHAVRGPAPPGRAGPHPVRRVGHRSGFGYDPAARRADQPPRRRLHRLAARLPAGAHRRPGRHQPRRRACSTTSSTGCGTSTPTAARSTCTTWAGRTTSTRARPTSGVDAASEPTPRRRPPRCAPRPTRWAPRPPRPGRRSTCCDAPSGCSAGLDEVRVADKVARMRFPAPAACGRTPLMAEGLTKSYGSLEVFAGVDLAVDQGRAWWCSASTVPARRRCCACSPASRRPTPGRWCPATGCGSGTTRRSTRPSTTTARCCENIAPRRARRPA